MLQIVLEKHLDVNGDPSERVLQYGYLNSYHHDLESNHFGEHPAKSRYSHETYETRDQLCAKSNESEISISASEDTHDRAAAADHRPGLDL